MEERCLEGVMPSGWIILQLLLKKIFELIPIITSKGGETSMEVSIILEGLRQDRKSKQEITEKLIGKTKNKLLKILRKSSVNPFLLYKKFTLSSKQLKIHEIRCLCLLCFCLPRENVFGWELKLFLEQKARVHDPLSTLLLQSTSLNEVLYRVNNLGPKRLQNLLRSVEDGLSSGLKKLRVCLPGQKVKYPIRKRGYNDKGSMNKDSAWKSSRAFWLDTEIQFDKYREEVISKDMEEFLRGFTD